MIETARTWFLVGTPRSRSDTTELSRRLQSVSANNGGADPLRNLPMSNSIRREATSWAWSVRLKEEPPEDAPQFLTYPRSEQGTSFIDDTCGAWEIEFARDHTQLRIHLTDSIKMRRMGKTRSIMTVVAEIDSPLGTEDSNNP